jgi:magnesium-transporting ATPase (P-type)
LFDEGDQIPADGMAIESNDLKIDTSPLTGMSIVSNKIDSHTT